MDWSGNYDSDACSNMTQNDRVQESHERGIVEDIVEIEHLLNCFIALFF